VPEVEPTDRLLDPRWPTASGHDGLMAVILGLVVVGLLVYAIVMAIHGRRR
jgi:hypothetical protein